MAAHRSFTSVGWSASAEIADVHRGLVLVAGATGNGKTTTMAAMLRHIKRGPPVLPGALRASRRWFGARSGLLPSA